MSYQFWISVINKTNKKVANSHKLSHVDSEKHSRSFLFQQEFLFKGAMQSVLGALFKGINGKLEALAFIPLIVNNHS